MLVKLLTVLFDHLIGPLPDDERARLRAAFLDLVRAAAEGAARGARTDG